jgi:hypothetical protein
MDILSTIYDFGFQLKSHDSWQVVHVFEFSFPFPTGNSTWWPFVYIYFFFSSEFLFDIMGFVNMISSLILGPKWNHELTNEITFASDSYD